MNNKGFYTSTTIFILLMVSIVFIGLSTISIRNLYNNTKSLEQTLIDNVNNRNTLERTKMRLLDNPSIHGSFNILDMDVVISEKSSINTLVNKNNTLYSGEEGNIDLYITNKTDVVMDFIFIENPDLAPWEECYYELNMGREAPYSSKFPNGKYSVSNTIIIPNEYFYNNELDETHYKDNGVGNINIKVHNGTLDYSIRYEVLKERDVDILINNRYKFDLNLKRDSEYESFSISRGGA